MFSRRDRRDDDRERGGAPTGGGYAPAGGGSANTGLLEVIARLDALGAAVRALGDDVDRHEEDIRDLLAAAAGSGSGDVLDEARRRALDVAEDLQHLWLRAWQADGERGAGRAVGSAREQAWGVGELLRRVLGAAGGDGGASGFAGADRGSVEADGAALRGAAVEVGVEFSWDAVPPGRADGQSGMPPGAGSSTPPGAGSGTSSGAGGGSELWPGCAAGDPVLFVVRPSVVHRGQRVAPAMVFTGAVERDGVGSGVGRGSAGVRTGEPSVVRGRGRWAWRVREHRERHGEGSGGVR